MGRALTTRRTTVWLTTAALVTAIGWVTTTPARAVIGGPDCNSIAVSEKPDTGAAAFYGMTDIPGTDDAYAVGYSSLNNHDSAKAKYFDGLTWSDVAVPALDGTTDAYLDDASAVAGDNVWMAGAYSTDSYSSYHGYVVNWDGNNWTASATPEPVGTDVSEILDIVALSDNDVWGVGFSNANDGSGNKPLFIHYNGVSWSLVTAPSVTAGETMTGVSAVASDDIWAVGRNDDGGVIRHWTGGSWQLDTTVPGTRYLGVVAVAADDVWAVGTKNLPDNKSTAASTHWTGSDWAEVTVPNPSNSVSQLFDVDATAGGEIWAVGDYDSNAGFQPLLERWDNNQWKPVPTVKSTSIYNQRYALAATLDDVIIGGWAFGSVAEIVNHCGSGATSVVADGGTLSTGDGVATGSIEPIDTTVDLPTGVSGTTTIHQTYAHPLAVGIDAPAATAEAPVVVTFAVDGSRYAGTRGSRVQLDGVDIGVCATPDTPPPCIESDTIQNSDDHVIVVRAADATGAWTLSQQPVLSQVTSPTSLTGPAVVTYDESVKDVSADNVVVRAGGTPVATTLTCKNASGSTVGCVGSSVRTIEVRPASPWVPGRDYTLELNPAETTAPMTDAAGNPLDATSANFEGTKVQSESSPAARYSWRQVSDSRAYGGSYRTAHLGGQKVTYAFTGTGVTWFTTTGPKQGKAVIRIDGVKKCTCDLYAAAAHFKVAKTYGGLGNTAHTLSITVAGTANKRSKGSYIATDAIRPAGGSTATNPTGLQGWQRSTSSAAVGGAVVRDDLKGSAATFSFDGTAVTWKLLAGPKGGTARVTVDGGAARTVDTYAPTVKAKSVTFSGLSDGAHTLKITVLGAKRTASSGRLVAVDGFAVT